MDFQEMVFGDVELISLAQDRGKWRSVLKTLIKFEVE